MDKSLFVDDLSITSASCMITIQRQMLICLDQIEKWAGENQFCFSKAKTVCIHFWNRGDLHPDPTLKINGSPIHVVPQAKFLGVIFDS